MAITFARAKQVICIRENITTAVHFLNTQPNLQVSSLRYPLYTNSYMQYVLVYIPSRLWLSCLI